MNRNHFSFSGSWYRRRMHMSHAIPNDTRGRGQVQNRRYQSYDLRKSPAQSRDGACRRRMGHPQPLFGETWSVPMQELWVSSRRFIESFFYKQAASREPSWRSIFLAFPAHRSMISAKLIQKTGGGSFDLANTQVHYERWVYFLSYDYHNFNTNEWYIWMRISTCQV